MNRKEIENQETLYGKLEEYSESDFYPFHMPGHKRQPLNGSDKSPYLYDITEIDGFDNLHHPEGIIKQRLEQVSEFYKSKKSYYLVNGSTCGIMAAISAVCERKKTIILARNSHKSSYNTVFLLNLKSEYLYPDYIEEYGINGGISSEQVEMFLSEYKNADEIGGIFITSPTYEGVVSDVRKIAESAHKRGIPLIVDEAHGAHFGMYKYFPESALALGADIVIQSLHKTLPSFTQTAMVHIGKESVVEPAVLERYLAIYQSSSPSYVLMAGIDRCMDMLIEDRQSRFLVYAERLDAFRKKCKNLKYFKLFFRKNVSGIYDYDKSKLVILPDIRYYNGKKLYDTFLNKYHLQLEMASERYVIAMTSVSDTQEGFDRLYAALEDMERDIRIAVRYRQIYADQSANGGSVRSFETDTLGYAGGLPGQSARKAVVCRKIREAYEEKYDMIELAKARGKISEEFIYLYPPGIPVLTPGEIITDEIIKDVERYLQEGLNVQGMADENCRMIRVVRENWEPIQFGELFS